jgi:hypothetical protein
LHLKILTAVAQARKPGNRGTVLLPNVAHHRLLRRVRCCVRYQPRELSHLRRTYGQYLFHKLLGAHDPCCGSTSSSPHVSTLHVPLRTASLRSLKTVNVSRLHHMDCGLPYLTTRCDMQAYMMRQMSEARCRNFLGYENGPNPKCFIMDKSLRPADVQIDSLRPAMLTSKRLSLPHMRRPANSKCNDSFHDMYYARANIVS